MQTQDLPLFAEATVQGDALPGAEPAGLNDRVRVLHRRICAVAPGVARMACALYEPSTGLLKTLAHSTSQGDTLSAYEFPLQQSPSLTALARERRTRVIDDIPVALPGQAEHSRWLREQGYQSSYTVPLEHHSDFDGFLFFDSREPAYFTPALTAQLDVYGQLVALMISHELMSIRALVGSVRLAREFAHLRDIETGVHLDRMAHYVRLIARGVAAERGLSDEFVELLYLFAPLHDVGKIGVADAVLLKPGRLDAQERALMKEHVSKGKSMIERLINDFRLGGMAGMTILRNLVAFHHEYLDGSGYPHGLRGEAIPIEARICTVADIFDALTSERPYKTAWSLPEAWSTLDQMVAAGRLDPACVHALHLAEPQVLEIMRRFA